MSKLVISGLRTEAIIGVHAHERTRPQPILIDITLTIDHHLAAKSDRPEDLIVDYDVLSQKLCKFISRTTFQLIESMADAVKQWLYDHYPLTHLTLRIEKPNALKDAKSVAIELVCNESTT